ncbi:hypothetical protein V8C35DRAFT_258627 [Trichoderma chlorosporum]
MSRSDATDSMLPLDQTDEEPIELTSKPIHKFFEPVVLLLALTDAVRNIAKPRPPEENIDAQDPKQLFCAFVNKLSHVCDKRKGGALVTSFVVLKDEKNPNHAHYVFAVNQQSNSELNDTALYVKTLLRKVGQAPEGRENQHDARHSLLYHVLRFNRPRVAFYLRELRKHAEKCFEKCFEACDAEKADDNNLLVEELTEILTSPQDGSGNKDSEAAYFHKCETTIRQLTRMEKQSRVGKIIEERAAENRMAGYTSMECWADILHTIKRIVAYQQSVQFFLMAKDMWPNLFENFTVDFVASSRPMSRIPGRNKSYSAESIVGRMTRRADEIAKFREFVKTLQAYDLDERIKAEFTRPSFKPIVHSEVVLLNWISTQGVIEPSRFFNDWKYIGSSKPACKLCDYYFSEHHSHVEHRTSHGNLYANWRVPDVFPHQGIAGIKTREVMLDRLLVRVRKDAFNIVVDRIIPSVKRCDSNTHSAGVTLWDLKSLQDSDSDVDDLASTLGQMDTKFRE